MATVRIAGVAAIVVASVALAWATPASAFVDFEAAADDGSRVIFETDDQLTATDMDGHLDVYERSGNTTTQVSQGQINGNGAGSIGFAGSSADASHVFFHTDEQLASGDANNVTDVYQRFNGTTILVSGGGGSLGASWSGVSADGSSVVFQSFAQLVPEDQDNDLDLYERADFTNTRLVTACDGVCADTNNLTPAFGGASTDGSRLLFATAEQILGADTDNEPDVYERSGGTTTLVSQGEAACQPGCGNGAFVSSSVEKSPDGARVLFETEEQLGDEDDDSSSDIYQRFAGATTLLTPGTTDGFEQREVSVDATRLFVQTPEALVPEDEDAEYDVYEFSAGTPTLLSRGEPGCQPACGNAELEANLRRVAADGERVFFESEEQLTSTDTDQARDVYERSGGVTTHVSRGQINGNSDEFEADLDGISSDGASAFFSTDEQLAGTDTDTVADIYRRSGGGTTQVSRGQINGNGAFSPAFLRASGDGSRVLFQTTERLVPGDTDTEHDIYERSGGTTKLVSAEGIPPQTSIGSGPSGATPDTTPRFTFSSSEAGSSFLCSVDGGGFAPCTSPRTLGPLGNGPHTFRVRAKDPVGNVDATPASRSFKVRAAPPAGDDDPPETTITSGPKAKTKSRNASFGFSSDEAESSFECALDGAGFTACDSPFTRKVKRKRHSFEVRAIDASGNADQTPAQHGWKVKKKKKKKKKKK